MLTVLNTSDKLYLISAKVNGTQGEFPLIYNKARMRGVQGNTASGALYVAVVP
jgi:hypothetical protein